MLLRGDSHTDAGEALAHQWCVHDLARRPRKPANDCVGCSFGKHEGAPCAAVEIGQALLLRGRQVWQYRWPCGAKRYNGLHGPRLD